MLEALDSLVAECARLDCFPSTVLADSRPEVLIVRVALKIH